MSKAQRFFVLELACCVGIGIHGVIHGMAYLVFGAVMVLLLVLFPRQKVMIILLSCALGVGIARPFFHGSSASLQSSFDSRVSIHGSVVEEVDRRIDGQKLTVGLSALSGRSVHDRVLVTTGLYPDYQYGDELEVSCRLEAPGTIDGFAYDRYLALSGIHAVCRLPKIRMLHRGKGNPLIATLLGWKDLFLERLSGKFPEPQSSLLAGILIGARRGIPSDVLTAFQRTGLTHIIALSGFNITILASATLASTLRLGLHRRHAFWAVLFVLVLFLLLTGSPSSVLRACIMSVCALLARQLGRPSKIWYAIVFAASVMALISPSILLDDVGFQLSFLATLGLMTLSNHTQRIVHFLPEWGGIREAAAAALAATAMTLPLIATKFGLVSVIAPVANILVVPLLPITMLLGFLSAFPVINILAAPITQLLLTWIIWVPETLSRLPVAYLSFTLPGWGLPLGYGILAGSIWRHHLRKLLQPPWKPFQKGEPSSSVSSSRSR